MTMAPTFTDATGYPIEVGDDVMYHHGGRYAGFVRGTVVGFTPKMVRIKVGGRWRHTDVHERTVGAGALAVITGRPPR